MTSSEHAFPGDASFVVGADSPLPAPAAWLKVTDWPRHGRFVPFTRVEVTTPAPAGVGTRFVARTALGPLGFDDPMEVVEWTPPTATSAGLCRLRKQGRVMLGWAELRVEPHGTGSRTTWAEQIRVAPAPRFTDRLSTVTSLLLFGHVLRRLLDT